ncbi:hypothetical protein P154DRAFT_579080 [Amniculicola lignicola CBS 123094]|uniref:Uncharacterized protein n=1 Tax=Amniculicola lignicola CBS 123094 TaxID=1392246 RepID=A0A6A5W634_9PLEO|nr:hypothetical protein P154DRAFT_579080 [Amniculicola lignicola CBS 123094]
MLRPSRFEIPRILPVDPFEDPLHPVSQRVLEELEFDEQYPNEHVVRANLPGVVHFDDPDPIHQGVPEEVPTVDVRITPTEDHIREDYVDEIRRSWSLGYGASLVRDDLVPRDPKNNNRISPENWDVNFLHLLRSIARCSETYNEAMDRLQTASKNRRERQKSDVNSEVHLVYADLDEVYTQYELEAAYAPSPVRSSAKENPQERLGDDDNVVHNSPEQEQPEREGEQDKELELSTTLMEVSLVSVLDTNKLGKELDASTATRKTSSISVAAGSLKRIRSHEDEEIPAKPSNKQARDLERDHRRLISVSSLLGPDVIVQTRSHLRSQGPSQDKSSRSIPEDTDINATLTLAHQHFRSLSTSRHCSSAGGSGSQGPVGTRLILGEPHGLDNQAPQEGQEGSLSSRMANLSNALDESSVHPEASTVQPDVLNDQRFAVPTNATIREQIRLLKHRVKMAEMDEMNSRDMRERCENRKVQHQLKYEISRLRIERRHQTSA